MQGEGFREVFWSGALGSLGASGFGAIGGKFAKNTVGTIAFGALSGGIGAELSGGNFWEGAVIGGAMGAISYGLGKLFNNGRKTVNYEMETTSENTIKVDDSSIQNQNAKEAWQENWKEIYESTKNNKPAYLMKVGSVPKGYIEDPNTGFLINQETGNSSWAVTQTNYKNGIVIKHNLFLSKAALSSKQQLNYVMNHEFGHMVLNNNYGEAINKVIGSGLIDTAAHRAIQVTGSKFLQLNNWSKLNLGGVFKGSLIGNLYPEYGHLKQLEKLIIKIK